MEGPVEQPEHTEGCEAGPALRLALSLSSRGPASLRPYSALTSTGTTISSGRAMSVERIWSVWARMRQVARPSSKPIECYTTPEPPPPDCHVVSCPRKLPAKERPDCLDNRYGDKTLRLGVCKAPDQVASAHARVDQDYNRTGL